MCSSSAWQCICLGTIPDQNGYAGPARPGATPKRATAPDAPEAMCSSRTCPPWNQARAEPLLRKQAACTCRSPAQRMLHSLLSRPGEPLWMPSCCRVCTCPAQCSTSGDIGAQKPPELASRARTCMPLSVLHQGLATSPGNRMRVHNVNRAPSPDMCCLHSDNMPPQ